MFLYHKNRYTSRKKDDVWWAGEHNCNRLITEATTKVNQGENVLYIQLCLTG